MLCFIVTQSFAQGFLDFHFKSNNINGAIVIFDEDKNQWIFNDDKEVFWNTPIASHFHLWQTLVGLEMKVFTMNEIDEYKWDGVKRSYFAERRVSWNSNMNLSEALQHKNDYYFSQLKNSLTKEVYATTIEKSNLLSEVKKNNIPAFWNFVGLTNPNKMILFLRDLYHKKLPFNQESQTYLLNKLSLNKNALVLTSSTSYLGNKILWTIGVINMEKKSVFFSYRTQLSVENNVNDEYLQRRDRVLVDIFESLGY